LTEALHSVAAVIVAAGSGRRFSVDGARKQYREVLGEPLLARAIHPFLTHPRIGEVVVVLPAEDVEEPPEWLRALSVRLVAGGAERGDSVLHGLEALEGRARIVLVHDGARPLVSGELIDRLVESADEGGVVPGLRLTDTLKEVDADGTVTATPARERFRSVQTPQVFPLETLLRVHRRARVEGVRATDDAALVERYGIPVRVIEGDVANIKITTPFDLALAEMLARGLPERF